MCDPITLAVAGGSILGVSALAQGAGAYMQQNSANKAAEYNAQIQERNAATAELGAQNTIKQGAIEEKQHRLQVGQLIGQQRAGYGASGVVVDSGSALDTTTQSAGYGELDALTIRNNAATKAWEIRNQKADFQSQANLSRMSKSSPLLAGGTALLSGAAPLASRFLR